MATDPDNNNATVGSETLDPYRWKLALGLVGILGAVAVLFLIFNPARHRESLLGVAYDGSRDFLAEINAAFPPSSGRADGQGIRVTHAGSVRQAQNIVGGLVADAVILASPPDIDQISEATGWIAPGWRERFPHQASPFSSTIVFLVRAGNPRQIRNWHDLRRPEVIAMAPDPAVSGAGRLAYLALWKAIEQQAESGSAEPPPSVMLDIYRRMRLPSAGAHTVLLQFLQDQDGDVLLTWENEAHLAANKLAAGKVEVVYPSISILAEPSVAVVDRFANERGTEDEAAEYLSFLFSPEAQRIAARHYLRPRLESAANSDLPAIRLFRVEDSFGSWEEAWETHFGKSGSYETIMRQRHLVRGSAP